LCVCGVDDEDSGNIELSAGFPVDRSQTLTVRSVFHFTIICFLDKLRRSPRHWLLFGGFRTRLLGLFLASTEDLRSLMCYNFTGYRSNTDIQSVVYDSVTSLYLHRRLSVTLFTVIIDHHTSSQVDRRAFSVCGPDVSNSLPPSVTKGQFTLRASIFITYLFSHAFVLNNSWYDRSVVHHTSSQIDRRAFVLMRILNNSWYD